MFNYNMLFPYIHMYVVEPPSKGRNETMQINF